MATKIQYKPLVVDPKTHPLLADELADFDQLKDAKTAAEQEFNRLEALLKAKQKRISNEVHALDKTAQGFEVSFPGLDRPIRVSYVATNRVDVKALEAADPATADLYRVKSGYWMIKRA